MKQSEINEISKAFQEAWEEFFGAEMFYVPLDYERTNLEASSVYKESPIKYYDYANAVKFHGTLREVEAQDTISPTGKSGEKFFTITFVTQELIDGGVNYIDTNSIIKFVDRFGKEFVYHIYDDIQKVQLVNNKIFTRLKVRYDG